MKFFSDILISENNFIFEKTGYLLSGVHLVYNRALDAIQSAVLAVGWCLSICLSVCRVLCTETTNKKIPSYIVSANTVNTFKNRLDNFWSDQELVYDYKADLTGIGNRSLICLDDTSAL